MSARNKYFILFLIFQILYTQPFAQVSDSLFDLCCEYEDLIILDEEMNVNISGKKLPMMNLIVSNKKTVVIKSEKGLSEFKPFTLPKKIDELYIYHAPAIRNVEWEYDAIKNQRFTATFTSSARSEESVQIEAVVNSRRTLDNFGFFGTIYTYDYFLENVKLGDTLNITYSYQVPFNENWIRLLSNRVFFHGKYPKKSYKLSWSYDKDMPVDSLFVGNEYPEVEVSDKRIIYKWEFNNLPGCLDEPNSRPHKTLPHFIFVPKPYDFEYTHFDSFIQEFIPIYFFEAYNLQRKLYTEYWDNVIGIKNKNNLHYQRLANKIIHLAPDDTLGVEKMHFFQQYMVDSVRYSPALEYYNHEEDQLKQRPGVDLLGYHVEDNHLEIVYGNMVPKLGSFLLTAYPVDKRTGEISRLYNPTVLDNDKLLAILFDNQTLSYVIPKSDKNHYYFEELPFYYEDIPVLLLNFTDWANPLNNRLFPRSWSLGNEGVYEDYNFNNTPGEYSQTTVTDGAGKRNFNTEFRQTKTPSSDYKENYRKVQSKVLISLDNNSAGFKTRIILSGQYSTLTRCVYCKKPVDSTINHKYLEPIWNIAEGVEVKNVNPKHPLIYYPFKTTIITEYVANDIIITENDQFTIKPGKWLKLIYDPNCKGQPRFLDYYTDFIGSDSYSYLLEFDKPIKLNSSQDTTDVSNNYAHLCFISKQIDESKILLTCNYNIKASRISKDSIELVNTINQAIAALEQEEIIFEVME